MDKKEFIQKQKSDLERSIWTPEMFARYSFELSPDVPVFTAEQKAEIQWINHIIFSASGGYLHGSLKMYKDLKDSEKLRNDPTGRNIWKALNNGISKHELVIETMTNGDVTAEYFDLYKSDQLPKTVSPPALIAAKFTEVVSKSSQSTENLIIVGHGCALEAFAYYQEIFEPAFPFSKELGYGDWLWLRRKVIN